MLLIVNFICAASKIFFCGRYLGISTRIGEYKNDKQS